MKDGGQELGVDEAREILRLRAVRYLWGLMLGHSAQDDKGALREAQKLFAQETFEVFKTLEVWVMTIYCEDCSPFVPQNFSVRNTYEYAWWAVGGAGFEK